MPDRNDIQVSNKSDRWRSRYKGIIGRGANFHSMMMKMMKNTIPRMRRTITTGEDHAKEDPPLDIGTRINTTATRLVNDPIKSIFWSFDLKEPVTGLRDRRNIIMVRDTALKGTVIQNTHRH
jgi:hypothetical protein